ncbi:hypothetical protein E4T39_08548 [Aureobasidium subglaciale]|nr:hypothetical protein E4T39_08548 [Aureobasidium subglaciale]
MVKLGTITAANAEFIKQQSLTAVFVGATSGIGEFTVRELYKTHGKLGPGLRVILVGRNAKAAHTIIDDCKSLYSSSEFHFVQLDDLSLLRSVDQACEKIKTILNAIDNPSIDLLIQSQGKVEFGGRIDTKEGLDRSMSLLYYSRARFITNLLPHLLASPLPTGAKIISIYAAGSETWGTLHANDLSLTQPGNYSFGNCRTHAVAMKTMFFESLAEKHAGKLALIHMFPGLVVHGGFENPDFPWWFKIVWKIVKPFTRFFPNYSTAEVIGQKVLFLATERYPARSNGDDVGAVHGTDGVKGGGAYSVTYTDEINDVSKFYQKLRGQGFKENVLRHTEKVFDDIEVNGAFEGKKLV